MITYETYCKIREYHQKRGLNFKQIAEELGIDEETAAKYAKAAVFLQRAATTKVQSLIITHKNRRCQKQLSFYS